jgi:hypothetical protein
MNGEPVEDRPDRSGECMVSTHAHDWATINFDRRICCWEIDFSMLVRPTHTDRSYTCSERMSCMDVV